MGTRTQIVGAGLILLLLFCLTGAIWTAYWSLRYEIGGRRRLADVSSVRYAREQGVLADPGLGKAGPNSIGAWNAHPTLGPSWDEAGFLPATDKFKLQRERCRRKTVSEQVMREDKPRLRCLGLA